jgi:hypothetical protein
VYVSSAAPGSGNATKISGVVANLAIRPGQISNWRMGVGPEVLLFSPDSGPGLLLGTWAVEPHRARMLFPEGSIRVHQCSGLRLRRSRNLRRLSHELRRDDLCHHMIECHDARRRGGVASGCTRSNVTWRSNAAEVSGRSSSPVFQVTRLSLAPDGQPADLAVSTAINQHADSQFLATGPQRQVPDPVRPAAEHLGVATILECEAFEITVAIK